VAGEHVLRSGFKLGGLALEVGTTAALGLAGVGGQLDAINSEHFAADEALAVTQIQHLGKELGDVVAQAGDEGGDGGVVRGAVATEGDEGDVVRAGAFDAAAADDALAVGEEDDLEQQPGG